MPSATPPGGADAAHGTDVFLSAVVASCQRRTAAAQQLGHGLVRFHAPGGCRVRRPPQFQCSGCGGRVARRAHHDLSLKATSPNPTFFAIGLRPWWRPSGTRGAGLRPVWSQVACRQAVRRSICLQSASALLPPAARTRLNAAPGAPEAQGPLAAPGAPLSCILNPPSARKATNRTFHDTSLREGDAEQCSPSSSGPPSLRHRFYSGLEDNFQIVDDALRALYAAGYWHARPVLWGPCSLQEPQPLAESESSDLRLGRWTTMPPLLRP
jgi:hypothetical protein